MGFNKMQRKVSIMKVKDFIKQLNEIGYGDDTEIVFNMDNGDGTCKDYYCQSIYGLMPFTLNAIGIDIDRKYK